MGQETVLNLITEALMTAMLIAAPMLLLGMVVGVCISLFQAVTQINEMTLTYIPKILAIAGGLLWFAPWMVQKMVGFTTQIIVNMPGIARHGF